MSNFCTPYLKTRFSKKKIAPISLQQLLQNTTVWHGIISSGYTRHTWTNIKNVNSVSTRHTIFIKIVTNFFFLIINKFIIWLSRWKILLPPTEHCFISYYKYKLKNTINNTGTITKNKLMLVIKLRKILLLGFFFLLSSHLGIKRAISKICKNENVRMKVQFMDGYGSINTWNQRN